MDNGLGWEQMMIRRREIGQRERRLLHFPVQPGQRKFLPGSKEGQSVTVDTTRCLMGWRGGEEEVKVDSQASDLVTCFISYNKKFQKRSKSEKGRKGQTLFGPMLSVFIFQGGYSPQKEGLKTTEIYSLTVPESRNPKSKCQEAHVPLNL